MSFTVGLAIFAGALSVSLLSYIRATASEERFIREHILLESAASTLLAQLAAGDTMAARSSTDIGGRTVEVLITPTSVRADLVSDDAATLKSAGSSVGLSIDPKVARTAGGLAALSTRLRLESSAEDCLRQVFTYGRGGQARATSLPEAFAVVPGDQVDVRVSIPGRSGTVLWLRARFTDAQTGWSLHDYRRLQNVMPCKAQGSI